MIKLLIIYGVITWKCYESRKLQQKNDVGFSTKIPTLKTSFRQKKEKKKNLLSINTVSPASVKSTDRLLVSFIFES